MKNLSLRRCLRVLVMAPLAACASEEPRNAAAPTVLQQSPPATTVTAVVQPRQLSLIPVGPGGQPAGAAQAVAVQPVVAGERLDLQPVRQ